MHRPSSVATGIKQTELDDVNASSASIASFGVMSANSHGIPNSAASSNTTRRLMPFSVLSGRGVSRRPSRTMKKFAVMEDQVEFRQGNALKVKDLPKATVVTFYMLPEFMEKLEPQLKNLKPGTRLVAHDYPFPNVKPCTR